MHARILKSRKLLSKAVAGLSLASLVFAPGSYAYADNLEDFYFQEALERYFDSTQNARTFGMAGSSVPTSTDSSSVIGNPAGIGAMVGGEASATYSYNQISGDEFPTGNNIEQQSDIGAGMVAMPIGARYNALPEFGNFGLAWSGIDSEWKDDSYSTHAKRTQITAAYAKSIDDKLSLGYSLAYTRDKLQSRDVYNYPMGDGFKHTIGMLYRENPDMTFGASSFVGYGKHQALFGPGISSDSDTMQYGLDLGVGAKLAPKTLLTFAVDYRHVGTDGDVEASIPQNIVGGDENGNLFNARVGVEQHITDEFLLRAGYRYAGLESYKYNRTELNALNGSANYNAFSVGAGLVIPLDSDYFTSVNVDYGVEYRAVGDDDWQHVVTISLPFLPCGRPDKA